MAFKFNRSSKEPMSEINVTPFVDVMLVLLIIFMVTAPLLTVGVQVDLPETSADSLPEETEPLTLSINAKGEIFIQEAKVDYDNTILTFDEAVFNTGNTVTNFSSETNGRVNLGSIEQNGGEIETGEVFKVYFTGNVTSPVGLVSIFNTDAANTDGYRLILNLQ